MLRLITTTGARPEAWMLCERLMLMQDYSGPVHWLIVDDGPYPQPVTFEREGWTLDVKRPRPFWKHGSNTQIRNLRVVAEMLQESFAKHGDGPVAVIEDDDYYAPGYLSRMTQELVDFEMVGELNPKYFNCLTRNGKKFNTPNHTSLASTLVQGEAVGALLEAIGRGKKFVDIDLWQSFNGRTNLVETGLTMGIKGMPGRGGIGQGHNITFGHPVDPAQWLGEAYEFYKDFILQEGATMQVKTLMQHPYRGKYRTVGEVYEITKETDLKILLAMGKVAPHNPTPAPTIRPKAPETPKVDAKIRPKAPETPKVDAKKGKARNKAQLAKDDQGAGEDKQTATDTKLASAGEKRYERRDMRAKE